jgi:hypothetical protein
VTQSCLKEEEEGLRELEGIIEQSNSSNSLGSGSSFRDGAVTVKIET